MSRVAAPLAISDGQREVLETLARLPAAAHRVVRRAQVLLLAADGVSNSAISETAGVSRPTVLAWRGHCEKDGLSGFGGVATGRGRKPSISDEKVTEIVDLTLHSRPEGAARWSCRSMVRRAGVSSASVQRIWSARGLKPLKKWLVKHPRFHLHFIPTPSSWLNMVERWFRDLTDKTIRRGVFHSVNDLITAIEDYLKVNNDNPKPFAWTTTAEQILTKIACERVTLQ